MTPSCEEQQELKEGRRISGIEMETPLVKMCIDAATESGEAVEAWRRQRRTLERLPPHLGQSLFHRLLRRRLLFPSLLEVFKYSIEEVDLRGESYVDVEWMAYIGAFEFLCLLNLADCHKINNSAIWSITGLAHLKVLDLSRCSRFTDSGVRHLTSIPTLEKLWISETGVTAEGITLLKSLTRLTLLDLGGLPVNDLALSSLQVLEKLQYLDLWGSDISNKGADLLKMLPRLTFLNIAWTKVTYLPSIPSLVRLNMSNCSINSIFEECDRPHLTDLLLSGAAYRDVSELFQYVETSYLHLLDLSKSSVQSFGFLHNMNALKYLDLSGTSAGDDSVEHVARVGANLRFLNLCNTRVTSVGVGVLAGHVPCLETILLSGTSVDDSALWYISMMPSLKVINLSSTKVKGIVKQESPDPSWIPSLSAICNLANLERLDLEEIQLEDAALHPLSSFHGLNHLSLGSVHLTDTSLHHLSSVPSLIHLGIRDAVLTDAGLSSFNPPPSLKVLDLKGCWLLTSNMISSFSEKFPQVEVRHEFDGAVSSNRRGSSFASSSKMSSRTKQMKQEKRRHQLHARSETSSFSDQRLKYTREELLALQLSSASISSGESQTGSALTSNQNGTTL